VNWVEESAADTAQAIARAWEVAGGGQPVPGGDVVRFLSRLTADARILSRRAGAPATLAQLYRRVCLLIEFGAPLGFLNPPALAFLDERALAGRKRPRVFYVFVRVPPELEAAFKAGRSIPLPIASFFRSQYKRLQAQALARGDAILAVDDFGILYP
jgi:hypothetical protein